MDGHSGHKSDPSVAVLTPAAKGLTPIAVNVTPVVTVLTPHLVQCDPSALYKLEKKQFLQYNENVAEASFIRLKSEGFTCDGRGDLKAQKGYQI